jgi:hypothetical protein
MLVSGIIEFCEITVSGKISVVSVATYELLPICCSKGIWGHLVQKLDMACQFISCGPLTYVVADTDYDQADH